MKLVGYYGTSCAELAAKHDELNRRLQGTPAGTETARRVQRDMREIASTLRRCNAGETVIMPELESEGFEEQISGPARQDYFDYRPTTNAPAKPSTPKPKPTPRAPEPAYPTPPSTGRPTVFSKSPFLVLPAPEAPYAPVPALPLGPGPVITQPTRPVVVPSPTESTARIGRLPASRPVPVPNYERIVVSQLLAAESYLCELARKIAEAAAVLEKIDAERDAATDPRTRQMLQARSNAQADKIHAAREQESAMTKQARAVRQRLAVMEPPILLGDPCGLWTDDETVPMQFGARGYYS